MAIGLKIHITLTHYEILIKHRSYVVRMDDFDLNLEYKMHMVSDQSMINAMLK